MELALPIQHLGFLRNVAEISFPAIQLIVSNICFMGTFPTTFARERGCLKDAPFMLRCECRFQRSDPMGNVALVFYSSVY